MSALLSHEFFLLARTRLLARIARVQSAAFEILQHASESNIKNEDHVDATADSSDLIKSTHIDGKSKSRLIDRNLKKNRQIMAESDSDDEDDELIVSGRRNVKLLLMLEQQEKLENEIFGDVFFEHLKSRELPRNPEKEGIYVPQKPFIPEWNYNVVVSRCLRQDHDQTKLFRDKVLVVEPLPIFTEGPRHPSVHPALLEKVQEKYATYRVRPVPSKGTIHYYEFELHLRRLKFFDFAYFSKEDLLCCEVEDLFQEYQRRAGINLVKYYSARMDSFKATLKFQLVELEKARLHPDDALPSLIKKIIFVLEDLLKMREAKDLEEVEQLQLLSNIYSTWGKVKRWREAEGKRLNLEVNGESSISRPFIGNPLRLLMEGTDTDFSEEKQLFDRSIVEEVDEQEMLYQMKDWLYRTLEPDEKVLSSIKKFDRKEIQSLVISRRSVCRQPGFKIWNPVLDNRSELTDTVDLPYNERVRRDYVANSSLSVALYIDGAKVDSASALSLSFPSFTVNIDSTFHVRLLRIPTEVRVDLLQAGFFGDYCLATVYLPIPDLQSAPAASAVHFVGKRIAISNSQAFELEMHEPHYASLGSEIKDDFDREEVIEDAKIAAHADRLIRGEMDYYIAWNTENETEQLSESPRRETELEKKSKRSIIARDIMSNVVKNMKEELDPNDPRNLVLLEYKRRIRLRESQGKTFHCETLPKELILCNPNSNHLKNGRIAILKLRTKVDMLRKEPVPLLDEEIPNHLYAAIADNERVNADPEFALQYAAKQALHRPKKIHSVSEVVNEEFAPEFSIDVDAISKWIAPSRKLRVQTVVREPAANPSSCRVVVQVVRAANIPIRAASRRSKNRDIAERVVECQSQMEVKFQNRILKTSVSNGSNPHWNQTLVFEFRPPNNQFVPSVISKCDDQIYFNLFDIITVSESDSSQSKKIAAFEKRWLGSLSLPFLTVYTNHSKVEGCFRLDTPVLNLAYNAPSSSGSYVWLYITLDPPLVTPSLPHADTSLLQNPIFRLCQYWFDEVISLPHCRNRYIKCFAEDENQETHILTQYVYPIAPPESKQGAFVRFVAQIPFMETSFASDVSDVWCTVPSFLNLGFGAWAEHAILLANFFLYEDIKAFEDPRQKPDSLFDTYLVLGSGIPDGQSLYVLRREINFGQIRDVWIYNACTGMKYRYDDQRCPLREIGCVFNMENVWANVQKLDMQNMSYDFGNSSAWYPMIPRSIQPEFISKVFSVESKNAVQNFARRPLPNQPNTIASAISETENLVDHELDGGEFLTHHEREELSCWAFCFMACGLINNQLTRDRMEDRLQSINSQQIVYRETSVDACFAREGFIRQAIQAQFEFHRSNLPTRWEYAISEVLRSLLADRFEFIKQNHAEKDLDPETHPGLHKVREIYRNLYGVPLNFQDNLSNDLGYHKKSDDNPIVQAVLNTGLHLNDNPNTRFALGVHVFPYYNNIASVWIYIAALTVSR